MIFDDFIKDSGYALLIINTLVFILSYREKDKTTRYFIMYLILCLFIQIFSSLLASLRQNNLFLSHFFFIGQFTFLSLFFSSLYNNKIKRINTLYLLLVILFFSIYLYKHPIAFKRWNVFEIVVTSIPLLIYSFYFFIKNIDNYKEKKYLYLNTGFFLYTLCSTLIFITGNIGTKAIKKYVWFVNSILYLAYQIFIFIEWYKNFRKPTQLTSKKINTQLFTNKQV